VVLSVDSARAKGDPVKKIGIARSVMFPVLVGLAITSCYSSRPTVLETNDVQSFRTTAIDAGGHTRLRLSGLAFHSALAVKRLERGEDGEQLHLRILLVPARHGLSGSFDYMIDVPSGVSTVTFGAARTVIWRAPRAH